MLIYFIYCLFFFNRIHSLNQNQNQKDRVMVMIINNYRT